MREGSQSRDQHVLRFAVMCVSVSLLFCGMLAVGHLLKVTCQLIAGDDMVLECVGCLDRLRLGVSPGDTSRCLDSEDSDN